MEQEIPRESLLVKLNQKMTQEFDKILTDARGIKKTLSKLEEAERNQEEIDELLENTLSLGNSLLEKIEDFKQKQQHPGNGSGGVGNGDNNINYDDDEEGFEKKLVSKLNSIKQD